MDNSPATHTKSKKDAPTPLRFSLNRALLESELKKNYGERQYLV